MGLGSPKHMSHLVSGHTDLSKPVPAPGEPCRRDVHITGHSCSRVQRDRRTVQGYVALFVFAPG